ncbi:MAG: proton-conducting transporter membrane subunit [Candidatus Omnitrophica bacterium]|nr:proton-conducting transporter membrane subunit [Candidatus Omnitrophota bacterium]
MNNTMLLLPILIPLLCGVAVLLVSNKLHGLIKAITIAATVLNLVITIVLFKQNAYFSLPWFGFGVDFALRLYHFSAFIICAAAGFGFLLALYSSVFVQKDKRPNQFFSYFLITLGLTNGAVLADNLFLLVFFWEGLLLVLFGMIAIGSANAFKTAMKAFIIVAITDLCMMLGVALCSHLAGTFTISKIHLPLTGASSIAFVLLMIGALSKAGSMPFHSWIPDAAIDAPLPFMAFVPAALEKLLGIYFLTRISLDMFQLSPHSWLSTLLMVIGACTILLAVMMALIQKNYKKLLSYHAISQVGYMILGIGTAVPAGIIGGLFHMINNALYKSGLFLTAGSVEKQAGTTALEELGGLARKLPLTFICFIITAISISGVPPFNGFFSKELIYEGALERGFIFYAAAALGSFFTAASFLKLGHAAFLGQISQKHKNVKEAPLAMLVPMIVIAFFCILFGLRSSLPLQKLMQPILHQSNFTGHQFAGFHLNIKLTIITIVVLAAALLNHIFGFKMKGNALHAADHIHHAPVLSFFYAKAEKRLFDPYEIGLKITAVFAKIAFWIDRAIDWLYETLAVKIVAFFAHMMKRLHTGNYGTYLFWSLVGMAFVIIFLVRSL